MRENADQNNFEYGHFSRSDYVALTFGITIVYVCLKEEVFCIFLREYYTENLRKTHMENNCTEVSLLIKF